MHYITNTLTIVIHITTNNYPWNLTGRALQKLLADNKPLRNHLHFDSTLSVREYLIIQHFSGDTTLIIHKKTQHESQIIDIFNEDLTGLVIPLTLNENRANVQLHLH